jgi:hypothetical protein
VQLPAAPKVTGNTKWQCKRYAGEQTSERRLCDKRKHASDSATGCAAQASECEGVLAAFKYARGLGLGRCTFANTLTDQQCAMCNKKKPTQPQLVEVEPSGSSEARQGLGAAPAFFHANAAAGTRRR